MPFISASVISPYNSIRGGAEGGIAGTLLLDLYPNAAAAYSLRKLRTAYVGSAIRVRRNSDNTEQDIGFVDNELDTASLLSFVDSGDGFVTTWYDQSGLGNDAIEITESGQASIVLSGVLNTTNGNVAAFGKINTSYVTGYSIFNGADGTYSGFVVSKLVDSFDGVMQLNNLSSGGGGETFRYFNTSSTTFRIQSWDSSGVAPVLVTEPISANSNAISSFIRGLDSLTTSSNSLTNSLLGLGTPRKNIEDRLIIMGPPSGTTLGLDSYFSEAILYPSDQTANRIGIEANINSNYNIYWDGSQTGLLDDYPNASAAYSLRALNSAYTGPAIRVRRSSDNAEQDINLLYDGSLNTDSLLSFVGAGDGFVTTWYDQSGNGYDAIQPFESPQPQIVNLGSVVTLNGKPTILSSVGKAMYTASNSVPVVGDLGERSSFSVLNSNVSGIQLAISYVDGGTNLWTPIGFINGDAWSRNDDPASTATAPYTANSDVVFTSLLNSTNSEIFLNGVSGGGVTGFIPQTGTSKINVFARYANVWSLVGQVSEIILYPSDQTANRVEIETNINNHYTIY